MKPEINKRQKVLILLLCCLGQFMVVLDVSVVNVALPSVKNDLGFSIAGLQWVVNAYTVLFAGFLLLGGRLTDLLPQRAVFAWGFAIFAGSSLICGSATDALMLTCARGVQGLGAAVLAPATLSILTNTFTEDRERTRAFGIWGSVGGVGGAAGMFLGGVFTQLLDWRWVFFINVPIGVVAVLAAPRVLPKIHLGREATGERRLDVLGATAVTAGLVAVVYAIVTTPDHGWASPASLVPLGVGIALLAAFVVIEHRVDTSPVVPLRVFANRQLTLANVVIFLLGFAMLAMWYFVTLYLQQVLGYGPIEAGLAFVPMAVAIAVFSRVAGVLSNRFGSAVVLIAGMVSTAAGMGMFALMPVSGNYALHVLPATLVTALGIGIGFVAGTIAATAGAPKDEAGLASGLLNSARQIGGSFGLAVLAAVAAARTNAILRTPGTTPVSATTAGYHLAFVLGAIAAAVGAVVGVPLLRQTRSASADAAVDHPDDRSAVR
ncbi:MFS transporter [Nocardia sp. NPDC003482]